MTPFRHLLHDRHLWSIRRRNVVPAFALGVFVAFLPIAGHMVLAALLALAFRINIPVAVLATWASNPVTVWPIFYFSYQLGRTILRLEELPLAFEASFAWLSTTFVTIWQPLLLGSVLLGAAAALLSYVGLDLLWRFSIASYKTRKRNKRGAD